VIGEKNMKQENTVKSRKELKCRLAAAFGEKTRGLSTDLQEILIDDMATAFENRLNVLNRVHERTGV
jgi:hypothetical protein